MVISASSHHITGQSLDGGYSGAWQTLERYPEGIFSRSIKELHQEPVCHVDAEISTSSFKLRYTVLVRRYEKGVPTLPSGLSSPSESNTPVPMSPYFPEEDEDSLPYTETSSGHLMPPQPSQHPKRSHRSWPGYESTTQPWSTAQYFDMQVSASPPQFLYPHGPVPDNTFPEAGYYSAQPSSASANVWDWHNAPVDTSSSLQAKSPAPFYSAPQHYDDYSMTRPVMTSSRSYTMSPGRADYHTMPNQTSTNVARSSSWSEQQHYYSLSPASYEDPRLQRNPSYRY